MTTRTDDPLAHDADLFEPTLDTHHDARGFRRPFEPSSLPVAVFFCGPLFGGVLVAWNWLRLGVRANVSRTLLLFVGLWLSIGVGSFYAVVQPALAQREAAAFGQTESETRAAEATSKGAERERNRLVQFVGQVLSVLPTLWIAKRQQRRFRIHEHAGGKAASLLPLGLLAFALNVFVTYFAYAYLWVGMLALHRS